MTTKDEKKVETSTKILVVIVIMVILIVTVVFPSLAYCKGWITAFVIGISALLGILGSFMAILNKWYPKEMPSETFQLKDKITWARVQWLIVRTYDGMFIGAATGALAHDADCNYLTVWAYAFLSCYGVNILKILIKGT